MKLTFVPKYATAKTVKFDEVVPSDDFLAQPQFGPLYIPHNILKADGWKGTISSEVTQAGNRGQFERREILAGDTYTMTLVKNENK